MKKNLLVLLFFITSCGESPLFNHKMEKNGFFSDGLAQTADYHFAKTKFHFTVDWVTGPVLGESKFIIKSWHKDTGTISGPYQDLPYNLHVYLWMPSMGHGSADVKLKKIDKGEYEISNVYLIMAGKWNIHVQLLKNKDVVDEVILPITL